MALFNAVNFAGTLAIPKVPVASGDYGGMEHVYYDEYVWLTGAAAADIIQFGPVAAGDRVVGASMYWDALGSSVTLAMGDDGSAARYISATSAASAGSVSLNVVTGYGFRMDVDRMIYVTVAGAAPTVGAKVRASFRVLRA